MPETAPAPFDGVAVPALVASDLQEGSRREWLETNGLGSFAMGTVAGPSTRRYHAILCAATRPPLGRMVLVNRLEEHVVVGGEHHDLSASFYPGAVSPDGYRAIIGFRLDPWPTWTLRAGSMVLERSLFMPHGRQMTVVAWRILDAAPGQRARLFVKPMMSGRDYHALHHENGVLNPRSDGGEGLVALHPYPDVPGTYIHHNGLFVSRPDWWRRFRYPREEERGLDCEEDLFTPGELSFDLVPGTDAVAVFSVEPPEDSPSVRELRAAERLRRAAVAEASDGGRVERRLRAAAEQFIVRRDGDRSVIAGYPWFTDWGRDTFISLPGLACATGWPELGRSVLMAWAPHVRDGLIPNRFPDGNGEPEYNSADAPLWYAVAVGRYAASVERDEAVMLRLLPAVRAIVDGYLAGTRHGIGVDDDGLVHAAAPGLQLTWMDAKIGDWVVTPRPGKPVEIQALWVAALETAAQLFAGVDDDWAHECSERAAWARSSFAARFWCEERGWLYDVVDGLHDDATLRPNQLYALGLCAPLVDGEKAERVLGAVERELLTPVGLRTRARGPGYHARLAGDQRARDAAYHEGTVWPFLLGIYADACQRVRGRVPAGLLDGIRAHLFGDGVGQLAEIFDGEPPHHPRGCPAQAWSVAETLRVQQTYYR
jgi:predicted glycogen debranching enzyme